MTLPGFRAAPDVGLDVGGSEIAKRVNDVEVTPVDATDMSDRSATVTDLARGDGDRHRTPDVDPARH
jgi:hypothetical protein